MRGPLGGRGFLGSHGEGLSPELSTNEVILKLLELLSTAFLLGCGDPLQPTEVVGSYTLATIAGEVPPRTIVDQPDCHITVVGGSLSLTADQQFELLLQEDMACPTPTA